MRYLILSVLLILSISCNNKKLIDENRRLQKSVETLKKENQNLKADLIEKTAQKYVFVVITTSEPYRWDTNGYPSDYRRYTYVSKIEQVSNLTYEEEYKILDKFQLSINARIGWKLTDRKLFQFDTYSEASNKRNEFYK